MTNPSIWTPGQAVSAESSNRVQTFIAAVGQTNFTITNFTYEVGTNSLEVDVSGVNQRPGIDFIETGSNSFSLTSPIEEVGTSVFVRGLVDVHGNPQVISDASNVSYLTETVKTALDVRLPELANYAALDVYDGDLLSGVYVRGVVNVFDGGHGVFRPTTDTPSSADGIYRQDALGRWWRREYVGGAIPAWFGALPGATDNSPAIQSWIDCPGQSDLIGGPFAVASMVTNSTAGKVIIGCGGSIKAATPDMICLKNTADNVTIRGVIIDGDSKGRIGIWNTGAGCSLIENEVFGLYSSANVVIGIYSNNTTGRLNISRNKIHDIDAGAGNSTLGDSVGACRAIYYVGPGTDNLSGFKINDNEIWGVLGEEGDAIHVANVPASLVAPYAAMKGEVTGNRIKDATRRAIKVQAGKVKVLFNEYEHTIGAVSKAISVIEVMEADDCVVAFNELNAIAFSYGVAVTQQTGSTQCRGNKVIGNNIESYSGLVNGASSSPIYINGVQNILVSQNKVKNGVIQIRLTNADGARVFANESYLTSGGTGTDSFISIESTSDDCIVTGNIGSGDVGRGPSAGMIKVSGNGNKVVDNHGRYDSSVAYVGISLLSGIGTKNIVERNSNASATQTVYAAATYAGNIIRGNFNRGSGSVGIIDTGEHVSADKGDAAATLTAATGNTDTTALWNTPLTAARTVTLSTAGAWNGARLRIVRGAGATGAFNLNVGTGPLKALTAAGQWCDVEYSGSAWVLTASGSL